MSQPIFFQDSTVGSSSWKRIDFGFFNRSLIIVSADRTNTDDLYFSTNGSDIMGRIIRAEPLNMTDKKNNHVYLKAKSGTQAYRIWAY